MNILAMMKPTPFNSRSEDISEATEDLLAALRDFMDGEAQESLDEALRQFRRVTEGLIEDANQEIARYGKRED